MKLRFLNIQWAYSSALPLLLGLFMLFSYSDAIGQESDLYVFGTVKDYDSRKKMEGCVVNVYKGSSKIEDFTTNKSGKFEFFLPLDANYKIEFTSKDYVTKHLSVDVKNIPAEDRRAGFSMGPMDVSLFKSIEGLDFSMLDDPIGKAKYYPERGSVEWDDAYTSGMLNAINKLMSDYEKQKKNEIKEEDKDAKELARKQAEFDKLVADGDGGVRNKDFKTGVEKFQAALLIFSDKPDVQAKLDDAKAKLEEQNRLANQDKEYNAFVDKGDDNFQAKNYDEAITQYQAALGVKAGERYPTDQIKLAEEQVAKIRELKAAEEEIAQLMADGDKAISDNKFDEGISKYEQILQIDRENSEVDTKLAAANKSKKEFEEQAQARESYDAAIADADAAFSSEDYENAISLYNEAADIMPDVDYPKDRAKESTDKLDEKLAAEEKAKEMEAVQAEFDQLVNDADVMVSNENFDEAIAKYDEALNLVNDKDQTVLDKKQAAIDGRDRLEALAKAGEEYSAAISQADEMLSNKDYKKAIEIYNEALVIKSDEQYPKDKIAEAEAALQELADQEAADLAADEKRREEEARMEERQRLFDQYMTEGDQLTSDSDFEKAIESYKSALTVIEGDDIATQKLQTAEKSLEDQRAAMADDERKRLEEEERLAALAAEEEIENQFNTLVQEGDDELSDKSYLTAIAKYEEALTIRIDKQVTKKIKDAQRALADDENARLEAERMAEEERLRQEKLEAEQALLDEEARLEAERLAEEARLKKEKLNAEQALLDEEARLEAERLAEEARIRKEAQDAAQALLDSEEAETNKYMGYIGDGDASFAEKNYRKSLRNFESALEMRPDEKYPASRIEKLEALIEQEADDERRAQARADKRREREEAAEFRRGQDLNSTDEDKIDNRIAQERRDRDEARWKEMEDYKNSIKDSQNAYRNQDNNQLTINQEQMQAMKDAELRNKQAADSRHKDLSENMQGYKEGLAAGNKRTIDKHNNRIEENKEELAKLKTFSKDYKESDAYKDMIESNEAKIKAAQDFKIRMAKEGQENTEASHTAINEAKKEYAYQNQKLKEQEAEKIAKSTSYSDNLKANIAEFNARGIDQQIEKSEAMAEQMQNYNNLERARQNMAKNAREDSYEEIQDIPTYRGKKDPMSYGENELASTYPQGVTEETSEEGNNIILRRIVVVGNKAVEYKKVTSVSGTFYFKNGLSTSKYVWDIESRQVLD